MSRSLAVWLVAGCAVLACAEPVPPSTEAPPSTELIISGFRYTEYEGQRESLQLRAGEFRWRKRRFGAFSFALFREIVMREVTLSLRLDPDAAGSPLGAAGGLPPILGVSGGFGFRSVTRVTARPLRIQIDYGSGEAFEIHAAQARIGSKPPEIVMNRGVSLTSRAGQRLEAARGRWRGSLLEIRGPYVIEEAGVTQAGSDALFVLENGGWLRLIARERESPTGRGS